ncbi:MAG: serine hydrolase domain-containing protein [Planctomycetota bacterium]
MIVSQCLNSRIAFAFILPLLLLARSHAGESFPKTEPSKLGLSERAIELLDEHIAYLVKSQEIVGGEIHVIKDRQTVLHNSYGWSDRETATPLKTDSIFCVRSMTKPLAGTAIQILLDEGKIQIDQPVAEILPSFDQGQHKEITIGHLLHHRSGLPFTIFDGPLGDYDSILQVAQKAAKTELSFTPGSSFQYSDGGTDTLGAIVQKVAGQPLEAFIRERVLEPLKMDNAYTLLSKVPNRKDVPSAYSGGVGNWEKHWSSPSDDPILPIFLASQGLYCTTSDYAKFLTLWMDGGEVGSADLLSDRALERALEPGSTLAGYPTGFPNLRMTYGQQWMLYHEADAGSPKIFGHNGSDGTYAWAWPQEDMIVLFFTQSRGSASGMELEPTIQQLLIEQDVEAYTQALANRQKTQMDLAKYVGIYWDEDVATDYYVVSLQDNQLYFERPGKFRAVGKPNSEVEGLFQVGSTLRYQFDLEQMPPAAVLMTTSTRTERQQRFEPDKNLPSIEKVAALVRNAYGVDRLGEAGLLLLNGKMKSGPLGMTSSIQQWLDGRRSEFRLKSWTTNAAVITNGSDAAATNSSGKLARIDGAARLQEVAAHPTIQYGGWSDFYEKVYVMRQVKRDDQSLLVVRAETKGLSGKTMLINAESGRIIEEHSLQFVPGVGYLGAQTTYSEFRQTGGITLPFHLETKLSSALLGSVIIDIESAEVVEDSKERFLLPTQ